MAAVLAIDQGTTSTRALFVESSGAGKIVRSLSHEQYYPETGRVEHDPEELLRNIQICIDSCEKMDAIGIDNQGESCLAWNAETKQAITPVIVWQDNRTGGVVENLKADNGEALVLKKAGLPLDSYFSASKLGWIMAHVPEAKKLHEKGLLRMGTTEAFFLDRLTGKFVTDITTASRTSLMNLKNGQWDKSLCELFNVPVDTLPEIVPTTGDFGCVTSNGRQIPVTASVVDQQAALFGHGCRLPGDAKITFGTGAFALVITGDHPIHSPDKGLLPTVAWQFENSRPVYALDGGVYSAGSAVNWARSLGLFQTYDEINRFETPSAIERDLVFVPALSGLACPHWDRSAAGVWIGLSLDTGPLDLVQSILEGVAFRAAEVIAAMNRIVPVKDEISIDGGLSGNPYFCQFLSDVLTRKVVVRTSTELTAHGTAQLSANHETARNTFDTSGRIYYPETDRRLHLEQFGQAVLKSLKWRQ